MAYLAILYEHLSSRALVDVAEGHCINSVLPPPPEIMPRHVSATFRCLEVLLRRVFRVISSFRRANLAIDVVLQNDVAHLLEDYHRLDCLIEVAGD